MTRLAPFRNLELPVPGLPKEPNALRYRGPGHVESWFLRANHPTRPLALWLKATLLAPLRGEAVAETWFIFFDGEKKRAFAHKETVPFAQATFRSGDGSQSISIAGARWSLGAAGAAQGKLRGQQGDATWDLNWVADASAVGGPLTIYPTELMLVGPFPKSKVLTPFPSLTFSGRVRVFGEEVALHGWSGMQGHNFGREHHYEYTWGQCVFPATRAGPETMVEGGTARLKVGPAVSPPMSSLVVRRGAREYRFDNFLAIWRQEASVAKWRWTLRVRGADGEAAVTMDAGAMPLACLGYLNPDGQLRYCFNTKLAHVWLHLRPRDGAPFQLESEHGGALEFLQHLPDPSIPDVV